MTWTLLNPQLFPIQLLQDLWTSTPTGTSFKDLTTPVSHPWLQGAFYNLTPEEIDFFTLIREHCSSLDSSNHQLEAFLPSP